MTPEAVSRTQIITGALKDFDKGYYQNPQKDPSLTVDSLAALSQYTKSPTVGRIFASVALDTTKELTLAQSISEELTHRMQQIRDADSYDAYDDFLKYRHTAQLLGLKTHSQLPSPPAAPAITTREPAHHIPEHETGEAFEYALVESAYNTHKGYHRDVNEDYAQSWEPATPERRAQFDVPFDPEDAKNLRRGNIYVVSDGVGGMKTGEVASKTGTQALINYYVHSSLEDPGEALKEAITRANQAVYNQGPEGEGTMATTSVCAVVVGTELYIAHAGDSRAYLLRDRQLKQLTQDHSWVARIEQDPTALQEYHRQFPDRPIPPHPRRSEITESLGARSWLQVDDQVQGPLQLEPNDRLLLCTDGLWGPVSENRLRENLASTRNHNPVEGCWGLIVEALDNGGPDNIGVLIVDVKGFGKYPLEQPESPKKPNEPSVIIVPENTKGNKLLDYLNSQLKNLNPDQVKIQVGQTTLAEYIKETISFPTGSFFDGTPEVSITRNQAGQNILQIRGRIGTFPGNKFGGGEFFIEVANKPGGGIEIISKDIQATGKVEEELGRYPRLKPWHFKAHYKASLSWL